MPFLFPLILGYTSLINVFSKSVEVSRLTSHILSVSYNEEVNFCFPSKPHQHIRLASYIPSKIFRYPFVLYTRETRAFKEIEFHYECSVTVAFILL
jgi:hypothetical protein